MRLLSPFLFFLLSLPLQATQDRAHRVPFEVGEILEYDLKWSIFNVGTARIEVMPMDVLEGRVAWHFSASIRTNSFADTFFKVRTQIDSWVAEDLSGTLLYKEKKQEGKTKRDIEVLFDRERKQITYTNHGRARDPLSFEGEHVFDPLGAVFYFRSLELEPESSPTFTVTDGKKLVDLVLQIKKGKRLKVKAGKFETVMLNPETGELGGVYEKSEDSKLLLWFSAGDASYPIQVEGEVVVGSFWAKLRKVYQTHE